MKSGRLRHLTCPVDWKGTVIEKDVSIIYYAIAEIEKQRRKLEEEGHSVVSSVCFDMPSKRKDLTDGDGYKDGRAHTLKDEDFEDIAFIEKLLSDAGHNTYRFEGYEADDLVTFLAKNYKDVFDYTIIYTPDKDLAVNIDQKVGMYRYKSTEGYQPVSIANYCQYFSKEFGCLIPYNSILLFLSTVGDKSDKIKGINKFGAKAFDKLIASMMEKYPDIKWEQCGDIKYLDKVVEMAAALVKPEQVNELMNSYNLVKPLDIDFIPKSPEKKTTYEKRKEAYEPYRFQSLYQ
jgi:5'-3' exonuclease